ncbi:MAG: hypothetical protein ACLP7F_16910 [Acidimicrobiales bacterium]|jgi:hypothetical protein
MASFNVAAIAVDDETKSWRELDAVPLAIEVDANAEPVAPSATTKAAAANHARWWLVPPTGRQAVVEGLSTFAVMTVS